VDIDMLVLEVGGEEGVVGVGEGIAFTQEGACDASLLNIDAHAGVFIEYKELL
jgi:hypothetical protein